MNAVCYEWSGNGEMWPHAVLDITHLRTTSTTDDVSCPSCRSHLRHQGRLR